MFVLVGRSCLYALYNINTHYIWNADADDNVVKYWALGVHIHLDRNLIYFFCTRQVAGENWLGTRKSLAVFLKKQVSFAIFGTWVYLISCLWCPILVSFGIKWSEEIKVLGWLSTDPFNLRAYFVQEYHAVEHCVPIYFRLNFMFFKQLQYQYLNWLASNLQLQNRQ